MQVAMNDMCIRVHNVGSFGEVNIGHWLRVREARKQAGLHKDDVIQKHGAFIQGMKLVNSKGVTFELTDIKRSWFAGQYISGILQEQGTNHRFTVVLDNISSVFPDIMTQAAHFTDNFRAV